MRTTRFFTGPKNREWLKDQVLPLTVTSRSRTIYLNGGRNERHYIYLLVDPLTQEVGYVGRSNVGPDSRLQGHCLLANIKRLEPKRIWFESLFELTPERPRIGRVMGVPEMTIVEFCNAETVASRETQVVHELWLLGCPLVNRWLLPVGAREQAIRLANSKWAIERRKSNLLEQWAG